MSSIYFWSEWQTSPGNNNESTKIQFNTDISGLPSEYSNSKIDSLFIWIKRIKTKHET